MALSCCEVSTDKNGRELAEHGPMQFPIACYDENLTLFPIPWHWHDEFEFIIITEGTAQIQVENAVATVSAGEAVFINSGILHCIESETDEVRKCHSLVFHSRLIGGNMDSVFWQKLIYPITQDRTFRYQIMSPKILWQSRITECMAKTWDAVRMESEDYENFARYQLSKALCILTENHLSENIKITDRDIMAAERAKKMLQFIEEHYKEEISLAMVASSASISTSACLRCFRQTLNTTPIRYLLHLRIEKAAEKLSTSLEKVNQIAIDSGFSDISYFTKVFREIKDCSPMTYRKRKMNESGI